MKINPLFLTDAYKLGHADQYPKGTETVYSNMTPRSLAHSPIPKKYSDGKVVYAGGLGVLKELVELWQDNFFSQPVEQVVEEFITEIATFTGPRQFDKSRIEALHALGYLPIKVKALPEGSKVFPRIPQLTIVNTVPEFYWITNYLETVLSAELWKTCTVATISNAYRRILTKYAEETGTDPEFVNFQAHDFSSRGLSGWNDQMKVGSAHLMNFMGTDTLAALPYLNAYYRGNETFKGGSVPATEHSVMCMSGEEGELGLFKRLITEVYPDGIVSIVSDTWDFWQVITDYAESLKEDILNRGEDALGNSKVVFRPDSGNPEDIICGTAIAVNSLDEVKSHLSEKISAKVFVFNNTYYIAGYSKGKHGFKFEIELYDGEVTPEMKGAIECLYEIFGGTNTSEGYKMLNSKVGLIYGDSITLGLAETILKRLKAKGFASGNIVLGVGSYSYQYLTRDTFGYAIKATFGVVNGEDREIYKNPKTGDGVKKSAKGLLYVGTDENGEYFLEDQVSREKENQGALELIFEDGTFYNEPTLEGIRQKLM